jgi:protein-L-isoaspartate(D-aspartate) O-methyltransferase
MVARMTSELEVAPGDRVLEIGTGSGYQAAVLAHLTDRVYSIEIVEPLAARTEALFADLIEQGYDAYADLRLREGDGYHGWPDAAPFDRIIVTAAIDHIPPPLLRQLAVGGTMLIPVGPPMAQVLLEVEKIERPDGTVEIARRDVYEGRGLVAFVPMTGLDGRPRSR